MSKHRPCMFLHCNKPLRLAALVLIWAGIATTSAAAAQVYLQEVTDMPLPTGFSEDVSAGSALPELGWVTVGKPDALTWRRDGEALRLEVAAAGSQIVIRFHIAPQ